MAQAAVLLAAKLYEPVDLSRRIYRRTPAPAGLQPSEIRLSLSEQEDVARAIRQSRDELDALKPLLREMLERSFESRKQISQDEVELLLIGQPFPSGQDGMTLIQSRELRLTDEFVPRSDLVLFTTSADHPLTESERQFLSYIRHWRKKIVLVLNKVDTKDDGEVDEVVAFIDDKCRELLGFKPLIFPVSAKLALSAKLGGPLRDWTRRTISGRSGPISGPGPAMAAAAQRPRSPLRVSRKVT